MKQLLSSGIKMRNVFTYMQTNEPANDATCSDLSRWVLEAVANSERCGICVREHGQVSYATGVVPFLKYVHLIEECGPNEKGDFVMYKVVRTKYKYTRDLSVLERLASEFEKLDPRLRATIEDAPHLIDVYEALCDILKRSFFKKAVPTGADVAGLICRKICHQRCLDPTELRDWEAVTMSTLIRVCPDEHRHLEQWGGDLTADCLEGYCDSPFHASMWSCLCEGLRLPSGDQLTAEWVNLYAVQVENALAAFVSAHGMAPCPETLIQNAFYETETGKNFEVQRTCSSFLGQSRSGQLKMVDRGWAPDDIGKADGFRPSQQPERAHDDPAPAKRAKISETAEPSPPETANPRRPQKPRSDAPWSPEARTHGKRCKKGAVNDLEEFDLALAAELSLLSEAPDERTKMAREAIRCFVCGISTLNPLRLNDKECLHGACSLDCLQRLHSQWIDIKCDLLALDASLP